MRIGNSNVTSRLGVMLGSLGLAFALALPARAGIEVYTDPNVGGFVEDSATPAFLDAVSDWSTVHLTFETDSEGEPIPGNVSGECICEGDLFHALVDFRSPESAEISPERVLVFGLDPSLLTEPNEVRMGGAPQYRGPLEINFIGRGQGAVHAFGVGNVDFGASSTVTLYDETDTVIGVYNGVDGVAGDQFTFLGFVATDGEQIGRAVMRGTGDPNDVFVLQDFTFSPVPEPGATTLGVVVLLTLMAISKRTPQRAESRLSRGTPISR